MREVFDMSRIPDGTIQRAKVKSESRQGRSMWPSKRHAQIRHPRPLPRTCLMDPHLLLCSWRHNQPSRSPDSRAGLPTSSVAPRTQVPAASPCCCVRSGFRFSLHTPDPNAGTARLRPHARSSFCLSRCPRCGLGAAPAIWEAARPCVPTRNGHEAVDKCRESLRPNGQKAACRKET